MSGSDVAQVGDPVDRLRIDAALRLAGSLLLALLYAAIAGSKVRSMIASLTEGDGAARWFIAVHLASGALFFGALAALMVVRHPPLRRERSAAGWVLPIAVMVMLSMLGIPEPSKGASLGLVVSATVITVVGTAITMYALGHLGKHFGVVADVRGFVVAGPYRWVRHPLYFGELCTTVGLVLLVATPLTVAVFVVGTTLQIVRAKVEERSVTAAFPAYTDYAARTPMLVPRLTHRHGSGPEPLRRAR